MRILLADDDGEAAGLVAQMLEQLGHSIRIVSNGDEARHLLLEGSFDAAIVERALPLLDGLAVVRAIREAGVRTCVLMVSARDSVRDRVDGLDAGADDYLAKPFAAAELLARMNAIERRTSSADATILADGRFELNVLRRELRVDGRPVALQPKELRLLEELMRAGGRTLTRSFLLRSAWGFSFEPRTNLVETHMSRLRTKLSLAGFPDLISTVRGCGYRLADREKTQ